MRKFLKKQLLERITRMGPAHPGTDLASLLKASTHLILKEVAKVNAKVDQLASDVSALTTSVTTLITNYDTVVTQLKALQNGDAIDPASLDPIIAQVEDTRAKIVADLATNAPTVQVAPTADSSGAAATDKGTDGGSAS